MLTVKVEFDHEVGAFVGLGGRPGLHAQAKTLPELFHGLAEVYRLLLYEDGGLPEGAFLVIDLSACSPEQILTRDV